MPTTDRFSRLTGDLYRSWEKSMTQWWDQVLDSPAFLSTLGENLTAQSAARARYEDHVDQSMAAMHLPSRKDVVRLARIATLLEDRILTLEDRLLSLEDQLARIEKETLRARVDAAEALVAITEKLDALDGRLAATQVAAPVAAPAPKRGRAAKGA